jgi:hypothetical protein
LRSFATSFRHGGNRVLKPLQHTPTLIANHPVPAEGALKEIKFMPVNLLDQIRYSCKAVAAKSAYIQINTDKIPHYAQSLPIHQAISPEHDPRTHYLNHGKDTTAFFFITQ